LISPHGSAASTDGEVFARIAADEAASIGEAGTFSRGGARLVDWRGAVPGKLVVR
jgi:hypothetical protein